VVWRFTERWLGLERLIQVTRDATLYPELTEAVRRDMLKETAKVVGGVWREGGSLEDLLRADHSYMSDALAQYYGLTPGQGPADADGFREVPLDTQTGLLTHGSLLTTHSLPTSSSPIHRGKLIRERFLCQELPPPPANLDTSPPPVDPSLSTRERYAQHASDPACRGCHELVDPIGFAFERYDAVGRWRERDGVHEIDELGEIVRSAHTDGSFVGVGGLAELLGGSQDVSECYAELWVRFGYGVDQELALGCYAKNLGARVEASGGKLQEALLGLTQTPHFLRRAGTLGELDVPGAELLPAPGELVDPDLFLDPPAGPGPDPEDPPDDPTPPSDEGVSVRVQEQSRWSSGYCADVFVTNVSEETLAWRASVMVEGRLNNVWNAQASAQEGLVRFEGVEWNRTIAPDQTAQFGFCAQF
jgi:cellulase/cellobiase CelA1